MSTMMRRWELPAFGRGQLRLSGVPVPEAGPGEVLVKVGASSINYRDSKMIEDGFGYGRPGEAPERAFTPGSDLAGDVVATGRHVSRFGVGDRVLGVFSGGWIDGQWPDAGANVQNLGGVRTVGTWAEYVVLPEDWLVAAPVSLDVAAAGTLTTAGLTAWTALVDGGVRPGQTVVVQGTGGVALFALQFAAAMGARVIVITSSEDKARRALALGAAHALDRNVDADWAEAVRELTGGRGADVVVEVTSYATAPVREALDYVATGGTIVLAGTKGWKHIPDFVSDKIVLKEITLRGAIGVTSSAYRSAIRLIESRRLPLERMHTHDFPLRDAELAIRTLAREVPGEDAIHCALFPEH
jgi:alcohol dehydrogenase